MTTTNFSYPDTLIIIFAREPVEGQVKTRLIPVLGEAGATELYKQLLDYTVTNVVNSTLAPVNLCITPESHKNYFTQMKSSAAWELSQQQGKDLGSRMYNALASALQKYAKAILIGTDCPFLGKDDIEQAIRALENHDMVFSPAHDGGYVLVGARRLVAGLFEHIDWGTEHVMEQSRNSLSRHGFHWQELSEHHDIDTKDDLSYLSEHIEFKQFVSIL